MTNHRDKISRGSGKVIGEYVTRLIEKVEAGEMTPQEARGYADNATQHASESDKQYATDVINQRLGRKA